MLSLPKLLIIILILVLIFGAKKLPEVGAGLGKAIQNFKKGMREEGDSNAPHKEVEQKTEDKQ